MQPALQVNISVSNQPSSLARVCDTLRAHSINISAITCTEMKERTTIHLIVDDPESAKIVLRDLGTVSSTFVLGFKVKNQTGAIASLGRACAVAGVNIHNIFATTCGKEAMVYISVDEIEKAAESLKAWEHNQTKHH
ncbi:MAG: domain protein-containing protein [Candidatus Peribacteria bacterium]|nr:domain protein-containing protein [Candidatus Peribacteria bacterium]